MKALMLLAALAAPLVHAAPPDGPIAQVSVESAGVTFALDAPFVAVALRILGPNGVQAERAFGPLDDVAFELSELEHLLADGAYTYELTALLPTGEQTEEGEALARRVMQRGGFVVAAGAASRPGADQAFFDQVILDDLIVQFSACVGSDCVNGESFGFDTFRLKENNLRIHFQDTSSSASFPSTDWRIVINDSNNGGSGYFAIEDATAGRIPFRIEANAPANALYVDEDGNVGAGTNTPVVEMHVADGDSPTIRLQQDGSSGFSPRTWDLAGNETNFFIRDVNNASALPFRIRAGAPGNSIFVSETGEVGLGTDNPAAPLHVIGKARIDGAINGNTRLRLQGDFSAEPFAIRVFDTSTNTYTMRLNPDGALTIAGSLTQGSSVHIKDDFEAVDVQDVLERLANVPMLTWRYRTESEGVRHLGPTSQDFMAAFGLGESPEGITAVDADGVALAAIQALHANAQALEAEVEALRQQNEALEARLARLEALVLDQD